MTQKEFENTIAGLRTKLFKMAKRFVWSSGADIDAEDIVQDTLLSLWAALRSRLPDPESRTFGSKDFEDEVYCRVP